VTIPSPFPFPPLHRVITNMVNARKLYGSVQAQHDHAFAAEWTGVYTVRARVRDVNGNLSSVAQASFTIEPVWTIVLP
jgi:hypothetical protein